MPLSTASSLPGSSLASSLPGSSSLAPQPEPQKAEFEWTEDSIDDDECVVIRIRRSSSAAQSMVSAASFGHSSLAHR